MAGTSPAKTRQGDLKWAAFDSRKEARLRLTCEESKSLRAGLTPAPTVRALPDWIELCLAKRALIS